MIVLELFCLVVIIAFARANQLVKIQRTSCRRDAVFEATDTNKMLVGYKIMHSVAAPSLMYCTQHCTAMEECRSINFKEASDEHNCQILDIDKSNASAHVQMADGWMHYEPIAQVSSRCRHVTCQPGYHCKETCDNLDGFECIETDECDSHPCQNNGTCEDGVNSFSCTCTPGYTGPTCGTNINECDGHPCQNNGTCVDGVNSFSCTCQPGYTGPICGTNINECDSHPCQNNGTCIDGVNSFSCTCAPGYTGTTCSQIIACHNYTILSESHRSVSINDGGRRCDDSMKLTWYRFFGDAGTKMQQTCPTVYGSCSTDIPGWLNGAHPSVNDGEVERTTCWSHANGCCSWSKTIKVRNCGDFFVYHLGPAPVCYAAYCGTGT